MIIRLNGRSIRAPWTQDTSGRLLLSEAAFTQVLGGQLLSTNDPQQQPVAWFSNPETPIATLLAQRLGPIRYLDITPLAQQLGWVLQPTGDSLSLITPSSKVTAVRAEKQPWGDRITLDLDFPTPFQLDPQAKTLEVSLDALTDGSPGPGLQHLPDPTRSSPNPTRTLLRWPATLSQRPQVTMLANPPRIVLDINAPSPSREIQWAPGVRWKQQAVALAAQPINLQWLELDPRTPGLRLRPVIPNGPEIAGTAALATTANQAGAVAAINGGYFNRNNQLPLGAIKLDNQWRSGPILNRGAIGWDDNGRFSFDRLTLQETLVTPTTRTPINFFNSAFVQGGLSRYSGEWGKTYSSLSDNEIALSVEGNKIGTVTELPTAGSNLTLLPSSNVLIARANRTLASTLTPGTSATIESTVSSEVGNLPQLVGGGPLLVKNSAIVLDAAAEKFSPAFIQERAARSAIGRTASGNILIVAAQPLGGGKGLTLGEIAQVMQQLGCVDALNLDGGSSTTLYLGGQILDRAPRSSARVHQAIGVFLTP
ncbi:MAG: phosphodiester glycosidase family protein [Alkalinema sp. RU_4_3]|nr:phosphodiester glycosidase family protein [Alkalinema sp. RU_4_3]